MPVWIPPRPPRDDRPAGEKGFVSLRDTFAAAALTGLLGGRLGPYSGSENVSYATLAYSLADAMLRKRDKTSAENTSGIGSVTLTDEEREAIEVAAVAYADDHGERFAAILRKLLERLHT